MSAPIDNVILSEFEFQCVTVQYKDSFSHLQVSQQLGTVMDLFSTSLSVAGLSVPDDRLIDGLDLSPVLHNNTLINRLELAARRGGGGAPCREAAGWGPGRGTTLVDKVFHQAHNGMSHGSVVVGREPAREGQAAQGEGGSGAERGLLLITGIQQSPIPFHTQQAHLLLPRQ